MIGVIAVLEPDSIQAQEDLSVRDGKERPLAWMVELGDMSCSQHTYR